MPVTPVQTPAGIEPAFDLAAYYPILIYAVVCVLFGVGDQTWRVVFGTVVFLEILVFLATFVIAYVYAWKKGVFQWR